MDDSRKFFRENFFPKGKILIDFQRSIAEVRNNTKNPKSKSLLSILAVNDYYIVVL